MSNVSTDAQRLNTNLPSSAVRRRFYSLQEVSEMLVIAPATLRRWRCLGTGPAGLPSIRVGGSVRYSRVAVDAYIAELEHQSEASTEAGT